MVSTFASQLQAIAKNSTHELDLKARRNAHAESLLFERDVAVKQDFRTVYNICSEGFRDLCQLDERFHDFDHNLFSEQAQDQDREQMTKADNEALDLVLRHCLTLLGGKIVLKPALKALEWLVRRFRVHVYNVDVLLHTLLPYHEAAVWANVLSIIPNDRMVGQWKFVRPYLKTTWNVPRHAVAYAASNDDSFFSSMNSYILESCRQGLSNPILMKFWSGIVVEAVSNKILQTRSGRKDVQDQRVDDLLHKILGLLSEAYDITGPIDLITTCYTISVLLAAKAGLSDNVLDSLLLAVARSLLHVDHDLSAAVITMSVITVQKLIDTVPKKVVDALANLEAFGPVIRSVSKQYPCQPFLLTLNSSAMSYIRRKNAHKLAIFSESLIGLVRELYPESALTDLVRPVVYKTLLLDAENEADKEIRTRLVALLQKLNEIVALSNAISQVAASDKHDSAALEGLIGMTIILPEPLVMTDGIDLDATDVPVAAVAPSYTLGSMPSSWDGLPSFLSTSNSKTFVQLAGAFESCSQHAKHREQFSNLPIWSSAPAQGLLWQTFLLRFAFTKASAQARSKATRLLAQSIQSEPCCEVEHFVPYVLALLSDAKIVRVAAADLLYALEGVLTDVSQHEAAATQNGLYDAKGSKNITTLQSQQVASIITDVIKPVLEECMLDPTYVVKAIQNALQPHSRQDTRKGHSQALFSLLTQHALATPLIRAKVDILAMLDKVEKVGGKSKRKVLLPIFQEWSELTEAEAAEMASEGGVDLRKVDASMVRLADLRDKHYLAQIAESAVSTASRRRADLTGALFTYISEDFGVWNVVEQLTAAEILFDSAFSIDETLATGSQDVLRSVDLPSEVLAHLLQLSQAGTSDVKAPPTKRRKRSSSGTSVSRTDAVKAVDGATAKIGLVLELVEDNHPELKPVLANVMFEMLASLRQLQQNRVESPYLLNLCLSSINVMLGSSKIHGSSIDTASIKPELVTECLRTADNPQVQNSSLLVLASLSTIVPDRMVHNVLPIFTFIGHNMLSKDDDHSINVINEAIDKIVPALLENLRKGRNQQSYQTSMASMLASFTSAYDHIPRHRRVAFYQKLLVCVKANEFGYMLVALLAHQQRSEGSFGKFVQELVGTLSASTQLQIYRQLLYVSVDVLASAPKLGSIIFNIERSTTAAQKSQYAQSILLAATTILRSPSLASTVGRLSKGDAADAEVVRSDMQSAFESTLTTIRDTRSVRPEISALARQALDHLLRLPTLADLLDIVLPKLDEMNEEELRPQALRVLALQIERKHTKTNRSQESAIRLLKKLVQYIGSPEPSTLQFSSLACIDRIVEKYGRKSPEIVAEVAHTIVSILDPSSMSEKWSTAALLTIAGIFEAIKEGAVPVVPELMPKLSHVLVVTYDRNVFSVQICAAVCTLLSAIFSYAAFVVSEEELAQVLGDLFSNRTRDSNNDLSTDFQQLIRTLARKVDLEILVGSFKKLQRESDDNDTMDIDGQRNSLIRRSNADTSSASDALLTLLSSAVEAAPKSTVIKQANGISELFLTILDRKVISLSGDGIRSEHSDMEQKTMDGLKDASIKFIYKINDTTFRPIFESWIDWADSPSRQTILFDLLTHFFDTLKAIVTSYASYLLKSMSSILKACNKGEKPSKQPSSLLLNTLTLLRAITSHDQDSFFAAPSHFDLIAQPLVNCLTLSASKSTRPITTTHLIPTIISLAISTMDSPTTHTTLTHYLVQLKSHPSAHVRGASILTLIALTEDEVLGDEFVSNVIGIGAGEGDGARGGGGSVGEIMVYVNEMLEDDDESVEHDVRRWVQMVRGKVGEDVFEV